MKKRRAEKRVRRSWPEGASKLRAFKKCLRELRVLFAEAGAILDDLLRAQPPEIIRDLCARFWIIQEYFAMRYAEARANALAALGCVEAALSFP